MFDTFFQKKWLKGAILSLILGVGILAYPFFVRAVAPLGGLFSDTFENYNLTTLNGQYNWVDSTGHFMVVDTLAHDGTHSIYHEALGGYSENAIKYSSEGVANGVQTIWFKLGENTGYKAVYFMLRGTDTGQKMAIKITDADDDNRLEYTDDQWNWHIYTPAGYVSKDIWHQLTIAWEFGSWHYKMRLDNNEYTSWIGLYSTISPIKGLEIATAGYELWFDTIGGETGCGLIGCSGCDNSADCQSSGCVYEYLPSYDRWECHAPYIAYVSGCGMGNGCYGCTNQSACESALPVGTCEWVDRGYGADCYPVEAPPPEATWEEPELESCEGLGTIETWLCEIRNFFAGLFMPTQEKVDNLRLTIENFKAKFPFNYANSLSAFFTTIKTGLDTDKDIPITMFGHSGNVNFNFLNATGSIGGISETMKNILYDFTTALIIFGFGLWLLSFIKRIF